MCTNTTATLGTTTTIIHPRSSSSSSLMNSNGGGGGVSGVNAGIVEPFPFSTFHFLRTCNRLLIPTTDLIPYYNFTKDPEKIMDYLSNDNKMITSNTNNSSHSNRHHHHHHHHQHQHHQKSDFYSSINDIFPISVTATSTPTQTISKKVLNKQNNTMNITSEQQLPSILSASTSTLLPHLSALDYHPLQLQPSSSPTNISSNDNTSSMEYPLGSHNRISELNYSNLLNRRQRGEKRSIPDEQKDEKYYERRKRNNEAAKKSRDARKLREDRIAFRAAILEQENAILRAQLIALREEINTMRQIIGTRPAQISVNL